MRALVVLVVVAGVAAADPPTRRQAEQAAKAWLEHGETALATSADPFLLDHDSKACRQHKKAKQIVQCLLVDETTYPIRNWAPTRVRVHLDGKVPSWQRDARRDVIARNRKKLAKLADHAFVHFDAPGEGGSWEMLVAVRLDDAGAPIVDGYLATFLAAPARPAELDARVVASNWVRGMAGGDAKRLSAAHRTGYPFWSLGLPAGDGCTPARAKDSKQFAELASCVAASPNQDLLGMLPNAKWEVVDDPATIKTRAGKDADHFAAARDQLDRLAHDHLLLFNKTSADDLRLEIVLAIRQDGDVPVVAAAVANLLSDR